MKTLAFLGITILLSIGFSGCKPTDANAPLNPGQPIQPVASDDVPQPVAQKARRLAEAQPALNRSMAGNRVAYIGTEVMRLKTAEGEMDPKALYRVTHYRYEDDTTIFSLVNDEDSRVINQEEIQHLPTALSEEELDRAKALALQDPWVQEALGDTIDQLEIEALVIRSASPQDPWFGRRMVQLMFRKERDYLHSPTVQVDLTQNIVHTNLEEGL